MFIGCSIYYKERLGMAPFGMSTGKGWPNRSVIVSKPITRTSFNASPAVIIKFEEISGSTYNDLSQAQAQLLPGLASTLVDIIRQGLETGQFEIIDGQITQK